MRIQAGGRVRAEPRRCLLVCLEQCIRDIFTYMSSLRLLGPNKKRETLGKRGFGLVVELQYLTDRTSRNLRRCIRNLLLGCQRILIKTCDRDVCGNYEFTILEPTAFVEVCDARRKLDTSHPKHPTHPRAEGKGAGGGSAGILSCPPSTRPSLKLTPSQSRPNISSHPERDRASQKDGRMQNHSVNQ